MSTQSQLRWPVLILIAGYTLLVRLIPYLLHSGGVELNPSFGWYPWNFSPVLAVCLFAGVNVRPLWARFALPVLPMLLSDLGIGLISGRMDWAFYPAQIWVYGSLLLCIGIGLLLRKRNSPMFLVGGGLVGCTLFFLITNFAVWLSMGTYSSNWQGLMECYIAAIPYFRNSCLGTLFFGVILFSPLAIRQSEFAQGSSLENAGLSS